MRYFAFVSRLKTPATEEAQREAIAAWCRDGGAICRAEIIRDPKVVTTIADLLESLCPGDTLIASELAALGKSLNQILDILQYAIEQKITVCTVAENYCLSTPAHPLYKTLQDAVAIQRRISALHTADALHAAASRGRKGGRPHRQMPVKNLKLSAHHATIRKMLAAGESKSQIARTLGCDRATLTAYILRAGL